MLKTNPLDCTFRRVGSKLIAHVRSSQIDDVMAEHLISEISAIDAGPECEHLTPTFIRSSRPAAVVSVCV